MTAPVTFLSGAPVAQTDCATGEMRLKENPAAHKRATALLPVAQQRSKLDFPSKAHLGRLAHARP